MSLFAGGSSSRTASTIRDYDAVAESFDAGNRDHDVSQNIDALLEPLFADGTRGTLRVVDLGCAGGRDLVTFAARGCEAWGVDGSPAFCGLAQKAAPSCMVLCQDFLDLDLPDAYFDGVYANASLFHVPLDNLPLVLAKIYACLKPNGVFFASNAHGHGTDQECWTQGRTPNHRSWVTWLTEDTWKFVVTREGFTLVRSYYRGEGNPGPFFATVWRKNNSPFPDKNVYVPPTRATPETVAAELDRAAAERGEAPGITFKREDLGPLDVPLGEDDD